MKAEVFLWVVQEMVRVTLYGVGGWGGGDIVVSDHTKYLSERKLLQFSSEDKSNFTWVLGYAICFDTEQQHNNNNNNNNTSSSSNQNKQKQTTLASPPPPPPPPKKKQKKRCAYMRILLYF